MLQTFGLVIPIFAIIAMGWLAVRRNILEETGSAALTGFAYWVALPALLFGSIAEIEAKGLIDVAGIYLACCLAVFAFAIAASRVFLRCSLAEAAMFGLNSTYGNVIYLATPLVSAAFGVQGLTLILAIIAVHSGVLLPLAAVLIEIDSGKQGGIGVVVRNSAINLSKNPIIVSILLGFLWRLSGLGMPLALHNFFGLLGRAAVPLALFCLGTSLPTLAVGPSIMTEAAIASIMKLAVLPISVGLAAWIVGLPSLQWRVAVLTAAMPTGANAFLLARRATNFAEASATTVVLTTAVSVLTISVLLNWMGSN
jgi:malonate transporter and related proteins